MVVNQIYFLLLFEKINLFVYFIQELRDIAAKEAVKGNHFFLEADIKGPGLKLDNTGKAILTVSIYNFGYLLQRCVDHVTIFFK
jgi:hypothetical protein